MKWTKINRIKQLINVLLLALITGYIINSVFFLHTHTAPNGKITQHAHPFKKDCENDKLPSHQHTSDEIILIDNLSILFGQSPVYLVEYFTSISTLIYTQEYTCYTNLSYSSTNYRGPPTNFLLLS